jgi:hypothetical protein
VSDEEGRRASRLAVLLSDDSVPTDVPDAPQPAPPTLAVSVQPPGGTLRSSLPLRLFPLQI